MGKLGQYCTFAWAGKSKPSCYNYSTVVLCMIKLQIDTMCYLESMVELMQLDTDIHSLI